MMFMLSRHRPIMLLGSCFVLYSRVIPVRWPLGRGGGCCNIVVQMLFVYAAEVESSWGVGQRPCAGQLV